MSHVVCLGEKKGSVNGQAKSSFLLPFDSFTFSIASIARTPPPIQMRLRANLETVLLVVRQYTVRSKNAQSVNLEFPCGKG
jgi:hypothetical protein